MDKHIVPGIAARHAAEAHREDLKIQDEYGCKCMTYWVDEERGCAFCLIDAPDEEAVRAMHSRAHGLIPHEIIQVNDHVVKAFLGRIQDPDGWTDPDDPTLVIFNDPAFRIILVSQTTDPVLLSHRLGHQKAADLIKLYRDIIREQLGAFAGCEVELGGPHFISSFVSVSRAIDCAHAIRKALHIAADLLGFRMAVHAGIPVSRSPDIFGETIRMGLYLCQLDRTYGLFVSSMVAELYKSGHASPLGKGTVRVSRVEEEIFLASVFSTLEERVGDARFGVAEFGARLSMSKSTLYRNCKAVLGRSPNQLLRDFRLDRSCEWLRQGRGVAETSYEVGFSSPSYFTKRFQKKYRLTPLAYQRLSREG